MNDFRPEGIPFHMIEALGVTRQLLEESGNLDLLLRGEKTALLTNLKTIQDQKERRFAAHLRLVRNGEGKVLFRIEAPASAAPEYMAPARMISLDKIPFQQISRYGITEASLKASGDLDKLLVGEKTGIIEDVKFSVAGIDKKASVRLYLVLETDESLKFKVEFIRHALQAPGK